MTKALFQNKFFIYVVKFVGCYFLLHAIYLGVVWLSSPQRVDITGKYLQFFNIVEWLRHFLLVTSQWVLNLFGYETFWVAGTHTLRFASQGAVSVNNSCLGFGVMSFWLAFIFANSGTWKYKLKWMLVGIVFILLLNITRIAVLLLALHKQWQSILQFEQHTLFNVFAYSLVFVLILAFMRSQKNQEVEVVKV